MYFIHSFIFKNSTNAILISNIINISICICIYDTYVTSAGLSKVWARGKLNLWAP